MPKIILTQTEAYDIIRKHLNVNDDFQIEISDAQFNDEWIDVPAGWKHETYPPQAGAYEKIQVRYRNGFTDTSSPCAWDYSWRQKGKQFDIVKYRKAK